MAAGLVATASGILVSALAAERLPFTTISPAAFPDVRLVAGDDNPDLQLYPDAATVFESQASYRESQPWQGQVYALVTLKLQQPAVASLAYYSPAGWAAAPLRALPIGGDEQVTLSTRLPIADDGLLRLMIFSKTPGERQLAALLEDPSFGGQPLHGLLAQRWFARTPAARLGWGHLIDPPWEERMHQHFGSPVDFSSQPWPAASVWLAQDFTARCKDCSLSFNGPVSQTGSARGSQGEWNLSQINELTMYFSLPELWNGSRAKLVVFAREGSAFFLPAAPDFQLRVNGFPAAAFEANDSYNYEPGTNAQPYVCDISPNVGGGQNMLRLRLGPLSTGDWKISGIQIWTD